ncbi:1-hydroxycarotenoid 3,4-desaturase CrtD [Lewinella sp. 4G2]|uniref:1-hydroxycarotenoid 3,4-desaturase CrtD n=1 Tax=Lewinella sp. 4G2 TaxID=1803372 RepID=UPI0007B4CD38|nr:1-hydroxycarotenoid 3,4-desaturase CrtD [Lewinella sp. 4G2]OAV43392.1 phytoene dehydrogenase [Lewinella sp. 4G2]
MHTTIIGAGIAGLAAAVRLAVAGHEVDVYERSAGPGGKLSQFSLGEYRFDFGPSLFTMPQYVDELFELAGEDPKDHFEYVRLPNVCHYWWRDGTTFVAPSDTEQLAERAAETFGVDAQRIRDFMAAAAHKYETTGRTFLEKSLHKSETWLDWGVAGAMLKIPGLDLFKSMNAVHERDLGHPKLVQLFNRFATYNGSNPYKAPGLLSMIPHFEHHFGAYLPKGGMFDISQRIYELGKRLGVRYHFNTPVTQIRRSRGCVVGIETHQGPVATDAAICNMDVWLAYDKLLTGAKKPKRTLSQQKSTSAVIFYWGVDRTFGELGVHNIFFADDYKKEFDELEAGRLADDVTIYVNVSSKIVTKDAPAGGENWFVMVNAPADTGQDWSSWVEGLRQRVLTRLNQQLLAPAAAPENTLENHIVEERIVTPPEIESLTGSHQGALYGTSSNNTMAAFLRHKNFSSDVDGLYFLGGSVHPGGGVPLCLLSAKITAELVGED